MSPKAYLWVREGVKVPEGVPDLIRDWIEERIHVDERDCYHWTGPVMKPDNRGEHHPVFNVYHSARDGGDGTLYRGAVRRFLFRAGHKLTEHMRIVPCGRDPLCVNPEHAATEPGGSKAT